MSYIKALGDMPFDGKRMVYGGFMPLLDVSSPIRVSSAHG